MALPEVEFELTAEQYSLMGFPTLRQGEPLAVLLDGGILFPEAGAQNWYTVQKEPLPAAFVRVGRAGYAFTGQIVAADIVKEDDVQSATVLVDCGVAKIRVTCAPYDDGDLPEGVWETRTITGLCHLQGMVEDAFASPIGETVGVTIWHFRRLLLTPGDAKFGEWYQSDELPPTPFTHDRITVIAHLHRSLLRE
ncbi:MAG: hypothetical protein H6644_01175 [Caldilineaceae bacterium]|nr:hypothetical protein [Caldilineaceae bacterium]